MDVRILWRYVRRPMGTFSGAFRSLHGTKMKEKKPGATMKEMKMKMKKKKKKKKKWKLDRVPRNKTEASFLVWLTRKTCQWSWSTLEGQAFVATQRTVPLLESSSPTICSSTWTRRSSEARIKCSARSGTATSIRWSICACSGLVGGRSTVKLAKLYLAALGCSIW